MLFSGHSPRLRLYPLVFLNLLSSCLFYFWKRLLGWWNISICFITQVITQLFDDLQSKSTNNRYLLLRTWSGSTSTWNWPSERRIDSFQLWARYSVTYTNLYKYFDVNNQIKISCRQLCIRKADISIATSWLDTLTTTSALCSSLHPPCRRESALLVLKPATTLTLTVFQTLVHRRDTEPQIPMTRSRNWGLLVKLSRTTSKFTRSHWSPIYPQLVVSLSLWLFWRMLCESLLNGAIKSGTSNSA